MRITQTPEEKLSSLIKQQGGVCACKPPRLGYQPCANRHLGKNSKGHPVILSLNRIGKKDVAICQECAYEYLRWHVDGPLQVTALRKKQEKVEEVIQEVLPL